MESLEYISCEQALCLVDKDIIEYIRKMINNDRYEHKGNTYRGRPTMPQGSSLSSLISNIVLYEFDKKISENSTIYVRYGDDILTTASPEMVYKGIQELGFIINENKTKTYQPNAPIEYLGFVITKNRLSLSQEKIREKYLETKSIAKKEFKKKKPIENAINKINNYWFRETIDGYSRFNVLLSRINDIEVYRTLDKLIMTMIISTYTGRHNKYMFNIISYEDLHRNGYMSLVYYFNVYKGNRSHYYSLSMQAMERSKRLTRRDKQCQNTTQLEWGIK